MKRTPSRINSFSIPAGRITKSTLPQLRTANPLRTFSKPVSKRDSLSRVDFSVFRGGGQLSSASIKKREINPDIYAKRWVRRLKHTSVGSVREIIEFRTMEGAEPTYGKITANSRIHGPLSEIMFTRNGKDPTYLIHDFLTVPWAQKQGFGGQIFAELVDILKKHGGKTFILHVEEANAKAIRLYKSFGFEKDEGQVIGNLKPDEMQMKLQL
jgi:GNAT superfamily N-acetyltransferase